MAYPAQIRIPATYMRGGTSKGVFFSLLDLPAVAQVPGAARDALLLRVIGSPDPYEKQIDGMGAATSSTSKTVIVSKSLRADHDVDYLFGQVAIDKPFVDWSGNCGNLSAAVGSFVGSWFPSAKAKAAGAPVKVNIAKVEPGQQMVAEWRGQPVFIVRRTEEILANLKKIDDRLADPDSKQSDQPTYVNPELRSIKPEILLLIGICTHLGCSPTFRPEVAPADLGKDWVGGYFCPCHGSHYDLAGRVYKAQPAPLNLPVPPYYYESDNIIVVGLDGETA